VYLYAHCGSCFLGVEEFHAYHRQSYLIFATSKDNRQESGRVESFGARLKKEREQRGITLDDIALSTKIGKRFLFALEEEHFEQLPGGIFSKGFVRAYARHLGIDEEQAIADYLSATTPSSLQQTSPTPQSDLPVELAQQLEDRESARAARVPWALFGGVLLIAGLGFALWGVYSQEKGKRNNAVASVQAENVPGLAVSPANGHSQPPDSVSGAFIVVIKAREDSWVSITVDGKQLSEQVLVAPAEKSIEARNEIVIKAGSVGALDFSFNGKRLPTQGDYEEVKTLTFDVNGLHPTTPKPPTPTAQSLLPRG
jgi:cytoskeleton protein RodZ